MTELLGQWVRGIAAVAVICGAALAVTPKSKVKNVLKVLCGVVLIIALIRPFIDSDSAELSMDMARYRAQADAVAKNAEEQKTNLSRSIIEQKLESYILDKAQSMEITDLEANVILKWGDEGFWYPYEIELKTNSAAGDRNKLSSFVQGELGIPESRQHWSVHQDE